MSVHLEKATKRESVPVFDVVYKIRHQNDHTTLEQDLILSIYQGEKGIQVTGHMDMEGLNTDDIGSAMDKMAEWCERMAVELRKERVVHGVIPIV